MFDGTSGVFTSLDPGKSHGSYILHGSHGTHGSPGSQGSQVAHGYMNELSDDVGTSSPAMSHQDHEASGHKHEHGHGHGEGGEGMMPMAFHAGSTETILFNWWHTQSAAAMGLSCLLVFIVAILYEGLKFYREWLFQRSKANRLNAGRDNYGHSRHHREQCYTGKQPVYSFRPQAQPQSLQHQHHQDQVPMYAYRPVSSSMPPSLPPHQHSEGQLRKQPSQIIICQHHMPLSPSDQSSHIMPQQRHHMSHSQSDQSSHIMPQHRHHMSHSQSDQSSHIMPQQRQHMPHSVGNPIAPPPQMMPPHHHHMPRAMGSPTDQSSHLRLQHNHHMPHGTGQHHIQEPDDRAAGSKIPWRRRWCSQLHLIQTLLHVLQVLISFLLMLIFMTFNIWLGLAVLLGAGVGYYIFGAFSDKINEHCN